MPQRLMVPQGKIDNYYKIIYKVLIIQFNTPPSFTKFQNLQDNIKLEKLVNLIYIFKTINITHP